MLNIIHVTHEAIHKVGGIGTVLEGLITSAEYAKAVNRTLLLCPLFTSEGGVETRLGPDGDVQYSSIDGRCDHPLAAAFREVQHRFGVEIVYGHRLLHDALNGSTARPEVALIGVDRAHAHEINRFKFRLHEAFGIDSTRYETSWDYEQYIRLAEPGLALARALGLQTAGAECVVIGHEFMGAPTALAAKLHPEAGFTAVYHAHEVATARRIVEEHPGHDTMFYNVLAKAAEQGLYVGDVFGDQSGYYRHALTEASRHLDVTLAVGDYVERELRFLSPGMAHSNIRLCYNGVPARRIDPAEDVASRGRLQGYAEALLGDKPDFVFTHVTRLVPSKGLWRDISLMHCIDRAFRRSNETAVLFVLATEIGGPRRREDILHMERSWDWPVAHREGMPDLTGGEAMFYQGVQAFNARARQCKIVFINQFGFDRNACGLRMPEGMSFKDIRQGSDVEIGQAVYEPFGISPLEALSFGALCVMSSVCGCRFFAEKAASSLTAASHGAPASGRWNEAQADAEISETKPRAAGSPNFIVADYTAYHATPDTIDGYKHIKREDREAFGRKVAEQVAAQVIERLPRSREQKAAFDQRGYELASRMSWDVVTRDYFLPAIRSAKR